MSTCVYGFHPHIMARGYQPGGRLLQNKGNYGTFKCGPNPGGDLEIFDSFRRPLQTA